MLYSIHKSKRASEYSFCVLPFASFFYKSSTKSIHLYKMKVSERNAIRVQILCCCVLAVLLEFSKLCQQMHQLTKFWNENSSCFLFFLKQFDCFKCWKLHIDHAAVLKREHDFIIVIDLIDHESVVKSFLDRSEYLKIINLLTT